MIFLALYVFSFSILNLSAHGGHLIRLPSFTLLVLLLTQVLFPQFKISKPANLVAVVLILGYPFVHTQLISP